MSNSPKERAKKWKAMFEKYDKNSDGQLDKSEFRHMFLSQHVIPFSNTLIDQIFQTCDADKSGTVSKQEFLDYMEKQEYNVLKVFKEFDADNSGKLDRDEVEKAFLKLNPSLDKKTLEKVMDSTDLDKSNNISFEEFFQAFHMIPIAEFSSMTKHFNFESVDIGEVAARPPVEKQKGENVWVSILAGGLGGGISRTTTAPLDRLKTMMQADRTGRGIFKTFSDMFKDEGTKGLFKGNGTNVIKIVPETAFKLTAYGKIKDFVCRNPKNPSTWDRFFSGGLAGLFTQVFIFPLDLAKTRLAASSKGEFNGLAHCLSSTYKMEGFKGLYRGLGASVVGTVPYCAVDLGTFNTLKDLYIKHVGDKPSALILMNCGALAAIVAQTTTYPLNLVRTRLIIQKKGNIQFNGMADCFIKTYRMEGYRGLFRGLISNYMKGVPAVAISYMVFEKTKMALNPLFEKK